MHSLLERQIRRHLGPDTAIPAQWQALLAAISAAYEQSDADRALLERSLELNSQELLAQNQQLEAASRAKTAFLANMSHEIRTPVTAIIGYADMVLEPQQTLSDRQDCLMVIQRNAKHLVSLINDILDISKIEAERMTVEKIPCEVSQLVFEVVSMMRPRAIEKGLSFRCVSRGAIPKTVQTDALRLKQILVNIIGNAIKFTARGQVSVQIGCDTSGGGILRFDVEDQGIGMSGEQLSRIFRPFTQADESMSRRFGGSGLGLAISKRLANLLGGDITVQSAPGAGSTFTIRVDAGDLSGVQMLPGIQEAVAKGAALSQPHEYRISGRILLAEDGVDNQHLISAHLRRAGAQVVLVENGRQAVDRARAEEFDLILMDMQMPEMDGYAATRELRRLGYAKPIIALTAHAMAEDRAKCLDAGCSEYLTKPIDRRLMFQTLAAHLAASSQPAPEPLKSKSALAIHSKRSGDPVVGELLLKFISRLPQRVTTFRRLLDEQNLNELGRALHQLKGAGGGYGFPGISEQAAAAEASIKRSEPLESIAARVDSLIELVRSVEGYDPSSERAPANINTSQTSPALQSQ